MEINIYIYIYIIYIYMKLGDFKELGASHQVTQVFQLLKVCFFGVFKHVNRAKLPILRIAVIKKTDFF